MLIVWTNCVTLVYGEIPSKRNTAAIYIMNELQTFCFRIV